MPKRPLYNPAQVVEAESRCANKEELVTLLGRGRSKQGMFLGDLQNGELEIGQCSAHINDIKSAKEIVDSIWTEFTALRQDPLMR
jgi:enoyl-[acyl-carrier protein] reductase II